MLYVGIDFHKKYSLITEMDEAGEIKRQIRLLNDRESLKGYVNSLESETFILQNVI